MFFTPLGSLFLEVIAVRNLMRSLTLLAVFSVSSIAQAGTMTFTLCNHPDGNKSEHAPYGLRLDFMGASPNWEGLFSVETEEGVVLVWDYMNDTAEIRGVVVNNQDDKYTVKHSLSGVSSSGGGFTATGGLLELWSGVVDLDNSPGAPDHSITSKQNGSGIAFYFQPDSHRLGEHSYPEDTWVGRGWHMEEGTNDWLVVGKFEEDTEIVPVPSSIAMLLGTMISAWGCCFIRRRARG